MITTEQQKILEQQVLDMYQINQLNYQNEQQSQLNLQRPNLADNLDKNPRTNNINNANENNENNETNEKIENSKIKVNISSKNKKILGIIAAIITLVSVTLIGLKANAGGQNQTSQLSQIPDIDKSKLEKVNPDEKAKRNQVENEAANEAANQQQSYQSPIIFDAQSNVQANADMQNAQLPPANINIMPSQPMPLSPPATIQPLAAVVMQNTEQEQKIDEKLKEGILNQAQSIINSPVGGYTKQTYNKNSNNNPSNQNQINSYSYQNHNQISNLSIDNNQNSTNNKHNANNSNKNLIFKAGDIMYATLINGINTDDGSTNVLAVLYGGKYNGSTLIGNLNLENKNISLKFNTLSPKERDKKSMAINAMAIRAEDARSGIAQKIDNHVLERYSYLFVSSMLKAIGNAAKGGVSTIIGPGGTVINTSEKVTDTKEIAKQGLGEVGNNMSGELAKNFNRPPSYSVAAGTSIGIIFTSDVEE